MSAATLFRRGGDPYEGVASVIDQLPRGQQHAATKVLRYLVRRELAGTLNELVTDRVIAKAIGYSTRFVQKGLHALHRVLDRMGKAIIDRMPSHGRRIITFVRGLAGRGPSPAGVSPPAPPQTPPRDFEKTTTKVPSSSPEIIPEKTPDDPALAGLVARACRLVPEATPGKVAAAIAESTAEWVGRALDEVERHNRKPGNLPVKRWGFVLGVLANFRREGGPAPERPKPAVPDPLRRRPPEPPTPPEPLTADQLAELVALARSPERVKARCGRTALRQGVQDGSIGPEQMATIPWELLPPAGPEVPAPESGS
jgi:hypothetical protein